MTTTDKPSIPPRIVLIVGILAVSTASLFIRFAQREAPSLVVAAYRLTIASLLLTPFIFWRFRKDLFAITIRQFLPMALAGLLLAFHFASWITSLSLTSVASSVVLVTTTPLWVAIASVVFLKERLSRGLILGLLLAMAGGIVVALSQSCAITSSRLQCDLREVFLNRASLTGNLLALAGAWFAAAYLVIGRKVRETTPTMVYVYIVYSVSAVCLLLACLFTNQAMFSYSPRFFLWAFLLALIPQIIGHTTYNWALGYLPTTFVSISLLGEPIGTIFLAFLFLQETPTPIEAVGGLLILLGIYLSSRSN
jgi:drug/metabolite transporter (DMT)-like permease